jgi:hypothetical protein
MHRSAGGAMIDYTITVGNIIEIAVLAAGGITAVTVMRNSVSNLGKDLGRMEAEVSDMKIEVKQVGKVLSEMALHDLRLTNVEQDLREMKHGRGFVARAIEGEYPR